MDKPEDSAAFRTRLAEAENRFNVANCVDREAEAKADLAIDAKFAAETKQVTCNQQRDAAAELRVVVSRTLDEDIEKPGTIDEDKEARRTSLEENKKRLEGFEAYIAANC